MIKVPCQHCDSIFLDYKKNSGRKYCSIQCGFAANVKKSNGCWLWQGPINPRHKYGQLTVAGQAIRAHRASYAIHHGPIPNNLWVLHSCDNPPCVNPDHLFLGTPKRNSQDMAKKGRSSKGEKNARSKLTSKQVEEIRMLAWTKTMLQKDIAEKYGVSKGAISLICNGINWSHL